jgi:hypothetical protein
MEAFSTTDARNNRWIGSTRENERERYGARWRVKRIAAPR